MIRLKFFSESERMVMSSSGLPRTSSTGFDVGCLETKEAESKPEGEDDEGFDFRPAYNRKGKKSGRK